MGAELPAGAADGRRENAKAFWLGVAGVSALLLLTIPYLWSGYAAGGGNGERVPVAGGAGAGIGMGPGAVDLSSMTPREAADRLFNRVMSAVSGGDQAEVDAFLPMAVDAYRLVPVLDADGWFHLSLLHQVGGDSGAALEAARQTLAERPTHLLGLYAAGEAARGMGDMPAAVRYFSELLDAYDAEVASGLPEYLEHAGFLPSAREAARDFVAAQGG